MPDLPEDYDAAFDDLPMGLLTKIPLMVRASASASSRSTTC